MKVDPETGSRFFIAIIAIVSIGIAVGILITCDGLWPACIRDALSCG